MEVGDNLYQALLHLRQDITKQKRTLWIDALCIDQANLQERGEQVKLMGAIFKQAKLVIGWLGAASETTDLAFDSIEEICFALKAKTWEYLTQHCQMSPEDITEKNMDQILFPRTRDSSRQRIFHKGPLMVSDSDQNRYHMGILLRFTKGNVYDGAMPSSTHVETIWTTGGALAKAILSHDHSFSDSMEYSDRLKALRAVFRRSFWKRLWIHNEMQTASKLHLMCGRRYLPIEWLWPLLLDRVAHWGRDIASNSLLGMSKQFTEPICHAINPGLEALRAHNMPRLPILGQQLIRSSGKLCTDPRDYVFANISTSRPIDIKVDYAKDTRVVYINATRAIISQQQSISIIGLSSTKAVNKDMAETRLSLPSWVPHFEEALDEPRLYSSYDIAQQLYSAGGPLHTSVNANCDDSHDRLFVSGTFLGEIQALQQLGDLPMEHPILAIGIVCALQKPQQTEETESQAISNDEFFQRVKTLFADQFPDSAHYGRRISQNKSAYETFERASKSIIKAFLEDAPKENSLNPTFPGLPGAFGTHLMLTANNKAFCITNRNMFALADSGTEIGDRVFVARGSYHPFIVRPAMGVELSDDVSFGEKANDSNDSGTELYELVSSAYVHGIMDGEVIQMIQEGKIQEEEICFV
ncbi:uncharacterized protein KY384_002298 [Bacidia gigantensis]|uniref:uncharacterized protein n=1 Tax=Bacidia gigantensis TaxID=2732470 RepID=UPI001D04C76C|nr:uncharacterized protein KY384_002298 [Bacidia gigantensis]KAG8533512.1 hypothetical protein KY384_002298 [Bacidia gigantensis]